MKFSPEDLNLDSYPPHFTNTYTCEVTITLRVCGGSSMMLTSEL